MKKNVSRRVFLERLNASSLGAATLSLLFNRRIMGQNMDSTAPDIGLNAQPNTTAWTAPGILKNPNILVIIVDQMRYPAWLNPTQMATLQQTYLPNIVGQLGNNCYVFQNYFTAGTACMSARATLLTGLYSPQTCVYTNGGPGLNTTYPTWGKAVQFLNPAYKDVSWFGKWHLSDGGSGSGSGGPQPLQPYGFQTGLYPGGQAINPDTGQSYYIPSPNGCPNEGLNGGIAPAGETNQGVIYASDSMIAGDFANWLDGQNPYPAPGPPWCATVSLINPHDIAWAPGWFSNTLPPPGLPTEDEWFPSDFPVIPPAGLPPALCTQRPSNWENMLNSAGSNYVGNIKPSWQIAFLKQNNHTRGVVQDWGTFLSEYYWLQYYVDQQVGKVLAALNNSKYAGNTIVIFTSDHGEYGGSHGMHDKSGAVYDESLHVPLYIHYPGQTGVTSMNQMCSSVDFFGLMCDFATGGGGLWKTAYPDLAYRQSIWSFLYSDANETRRVSIANQATVPYILHIVDESSAKEFCPTPMAPPDNRHIVCLRTKSGGKLGVYSHWGPSTTCWDGVTPQEYEFYDYSTSTAETGNNYPASALWSQYLAALGNWGAPPWGANSSGLIGSELDVPLVGAGLSQAQATAQQAYCAVTNPCNA